MTEAEGPVRYFAMHERYRKAGFSTSMADEAPPPVQNFDRTRDASVEDDDIQY